MKIRNFLVAALVALGFAACNTEDLPYTGGETGAPATLSFTVFADTPRSRTVGNLDGTAPEMVAERTIHSLEVWLFGPSGAYYFHERFVNPANAAGAGIYFYRTAEGNYRVEGIETTAGDRRIVAIANHSLIGGMSRTDLQNVIADDLTQTVVGAGNGLIMTSQEYTLNMVAGQNFFGAGAPPTGSNVVNNNNLQLTRINARIALVSVNFNDQTEPANNPRFDGFNLTDVAMFNVRNTSRLFGTGGFEVTQSLVHTANTTTPFSFGGDWPTPLGSFVGHTSVGIPTPSLLVNSAAMTTAGITNWGDINPNRAIFFYAFENAGDPLVPVAGTNPVVYHRANRTGTFIVLRGQLTLNNVPVTGYPGLFHCPAGFTYYAIWVNCDALGTVTSSNQNAIGLGNNSILRNRQYNISVNLWGPGNPTIDPKEKAFLDVHVVVADWEEVTQDVDWGTPPVPSVCGVCGDDPCTCPPAVCTDCGNDPCTCPPVVCTVCGNDPCTCTPAVVDPTAFVLIGETRWATRNVGLPGTFVTNPGDLGMMFQWGSNVAWTRGGSTADVLPASVPSVGGAEWLTPVDLADITSWNPCPQGWRLPTMGEFQELLTFGVGRVETVDGNTGRWFGGDGAVIVDFTGRVFLPGTGRRHENGTWGWGAAVNPTVTGTEGAPFGFYWTSTENPETPGQMARFFFRGMAGHAPTVVFDNNRAWGFFVRCVQIVTP